jgi:VanZ family protein
MRIYRHWLPVVLWMAFIFLMSSELGSATHTSRIIEPLVQWIKPDATPEQFEFVHFVVRKLAHLTEYAVLGLLVFRALKRSRRSPATKFSWQTAGLTLLIAAAYAATDEWHQTFVPGRTPAFGDVLIDSSGALISLLAVCLWTHFFSGRLPFKTEART